MYYTETGSLHLSNLIDVDIMSKYNLYKPDDKSWLSYIVDVITPVWNVNGSAQPSYLSPAPGRDNRFDYVLFVDKE